MFSLHNALKQRKVKAMSYHNEEYTDTHGVVWRVGDVLRPVPPADVYPFSDHVIMGFSDASTAMGRVEVKVARPYAYAAGVGTTGPHPFLWAEVYNIAAERLQAPYWARVATGRMVKP